jgi:exoribonuclease-2
MTHVLFEEDGAFKAGTVLADAGSSLQVEHATGRRAKIKSGHVMLRFESPGPGELLASAHKLAQDMDIDFLWECAPQDEFGFMELADEYFGRTPTPAEATGLLLKLHAAPVYFHRKGRGRYRPASGEVLKAALAAVERKRLLEEAVETDAQALAEGRLPESIARQGAFLLVRPDKQSQAWRALQRACERTHQIPERLLLAAGAFASPRALHRAKFAAEFFPHGTGFAASLAVTFDPASLPLAEAAPFSIDDSSTTEIDDCLSVTRRPDGRLRVGVHIAAPGCALYPGEAIDEAARDRMTTVYLPGEKITMLPERVIAAFSLDEGHEGPALSLYVDLDDSGTRIVAQSSRLERIRVAANLRHDQLEDVVTEAALGDPAAPMPQGDALRALWAFTLARCAERDRVRGKPEPRFRTDFSFHVEGERVRIVQRRRDAPLDRIVAEMMILANSEWGRLLAEHRVPGIYRSQQAGRVRTTNHPLPHQGLGVAQYMWSTSPLRRYVDLINQRQLIAVLAGERPPHDANSAELFGTMSAFDERFSAIAEFQTRMERFWCLRWLAQEGVRRTQAVVIREDVVRLADAPLYFRLPDLPALAPGRRIVVDVLEIDEVGIDLSARYVSQAPSAGERDAADALDAEALAADAQDAIGDGDGGVALAAAASRADAGTPGQDEAGEDRAGDPGGSLPP